MCRKCGNWLPWALCGYVTFLTTMIKKRPSSGTWNWFSYLFSQIVDSLPRLALTALNGDLKRHKFELLPQGYEVCPHTFHIPHKSTQVHISPQHVPPIIQGVWPLSVHITGVYPVDDKDRHCFEFTWSEICLKSSIMCVVIKSRLFQTFCSKSKLTSDISPRGTVTVTPTIKFDAWTKQNIKPSKPFEKRKLENVRKCRRRLDREMKLLLFIFSLVKESGFLSLCMRVFSL